MPMSNGAAKLILFEDNESVIEMSIKDLQNVDFRTLRNKLELFLL